MLKALPLQTRKDVEVDEIGAVVTLVVSFNGIAENRVHKDSR